MRQQTVEGECRTNVNLISFLLSVMLPGGPGTGCGRASPGVQAETFEGDFLSSEPRYQAAAHRQLGYWKTVIPGRARANLILKIRVMKPPSHRSPSR